MSKKRPNILFIQADQLAASFLPAYGHPVVRTPNIDRLEERGVLFERAYCNFPLCAPSRFSMMSGQLASTVGAYDNGAEFPAATPTMSHYLRQAGYRTAISGKMHFIGPDDLHGLEERVAPEIYTSHFSLTADWSKLSYDFAPDQRVITQSGPVARSVQLDYDEEVGFRAVGKLYDYARDGDDRPFFLIASFTHPHDPYICPRRFWDLYADSEIDLPQVRLEEHERDPHSKRLRDVYSIDKIDLSEDFLHRVRRSYYANITYMDAKVGELLDALDDCGLSDNTVIVFTTDHGDMMGERELFHKKTFYENASHVPLIIALPGSENGTKRVSEVVSLVDLMPTVLQIAGLGEPVDLVEPIAGRSLYAFLIGERPSWDNVAYSEILSESTFDPIVMIRRDQYKYIWSEADPPLLYDLEKDPLERCNLAGASAVKERQTALHEEMRANWDLPALKDEILLSQKRRLLIFKALYSGRIPDWDGPIPTTGQRGYYRDQMSYADWLFSGSLE